MAELTQEDILANPQVANLVEIKDLITYLFNPFRPHDPSGNRGPSTPGPMPGMVDHFPTPEEVQADVDSPKDPIRDLFYKADNTENPPGYIFPQSVMGRGGEKQSFPDWLLSGTSGKAFDLGLYGALGYGGSKIPMGKAFAKKARKVNPLAGERGSADFEFLMRALRLRLDDPKEALKSVPVKHIPAPLKKKKKKGNGRKK